MYFNPLFDVCPLSNSVLNQTSTLKPRSNGIHKILIKYHWFMTLYRNSHITIAAENRFNGQRVDSQSEVINQAPSIPQPRTNNNLALGVGFPAQNNEGVPPVTMAARKPPSGDANHRPGRHRSKPSTRETISRTNSTGRDRSRSRERSENKNTLVS